MQVKNHNGCVVDNQILNLDIKFSDVHFFSNFLRFPFHVKFSNSLFGFNVFSNNLLIWNTEWIYFKPLTWNIVYTLVKGLWKLNILRCNYIQLIISFFIINKWLVKYSKKRKWTIIYKFLFDYFYGKFKIKTTKIANLKFIIKFNGFPSSV